MIKKYGLLIGLFMVSASAFTWPSPAGVPVAAEQPTGWQQVRSALIWPFNPFEPMGSWKDALEKNSQLNAELKAKYWPACPPLRFTFRFLHCTPTTYLASGLYYCALLTGSVKGYAKVKKWLQRKDRSTTKNKQDGKLKRTTMHRDCPWCVARLKVKNQTDITEGSL